LIACQLSLLILFHALLVVEMLSATQSGHGPAAVAHRRTGYTPGASTSTLNMRAGKTALASARQSASWSSRSLASLTDGDSSGSGDDAYVESKRMVRLPMNVYGLAIATSCDVHVGGLQCFMIGSFVLLNFLIQGFLIHSLTEISDEMKGSEVCECSTILQGVCTALYVMIMWDEVSISLEVVEYIIFAESANYMKPFRMSSEAADHARASPDNSRGEPGVDFQEVGEEEDQTPRTLEGRSLCPNEHGLYEAQFFGYQLHKLTFWWKAVLLLLVVIPKLFLEGAMISVGSQYVSLSPDNEAVINSVVAVTFITSIDEMMLNSLVSARMRKALQETAPVQYYPPNVLVRFWVRLRTTIRMVFDPLLICSISMFLLRYSLSESGCEAPLLFLYLD